MKKTILVFLVLTSIGVMNVKADEITKYKSLFTLNFIRYVGWPEETKQGDFVIGVLQSKTIASELRAQTEGKKFGFQNIVIKEFKNIEELTDCQMIYVSEWVNYPKKAAAIAQKVGQCTLIISENVGAISSGSMINFVVVDDLLKFEVSPSNSQKNGLALSNTLISMKNAIPM